RLVVATAAVVLPRPVVRVAVAVAVAVLAANAVARSLVRAIAALVAQVAPHRCWSRKDLRSGLRTEPTFCASGLPPLKRISVGMFRMPYFGGVCGVRSMSTFRS